MQTVPKIVRDRLQATQPAVNHPDADLLTAFAEQSLPEAERATVLEHLSRCEDCRDVIALALPATEAIETVALPARSGWLTWPALRWGFVAAGVVVIAGIGFLQLQRRSAAPLMASKSPDFAVSESRSQPSAPAAATPAAKPTESRDKAAATPLLADSISAADAALTESKRIAPAAPPPAATRGNAVHGAVGGTFGGPLAYNRKAPLQWQSNNAQQQTSNNPFQAPATKQQAGAASPTPQVPQASETVEVNGLAPVVDAERASQESPSRDQSAESRNEFADKISVSKTKLPVPLAAPGQIGGYVVDPTGAVVSNARITITPAKAGGTATALTNSQGSWLIAGLPTGNYKAQAEAPGFKTSVLAFNYDANQPSTYSFTLSPGSVSETVEVSSAQNGLVQTEGSTVGGRPSPAREVSQIPVNGRDFALLTSPAAGPMPRWTISPDGALQRSFDQGNSWQSVDVNAGAGSSAGLAIVAQASRAKETEKDADKKTLKRDAATPTFRAVTAAGSEVWAGGSKGALYHSLDAGTHWMRVVPTSAGAILTGDIVSLEFPDPQHGRITTSTPEIWTTSDAGKTWQKQ